MASNEDEEKLTCPICFKPPAPFMGQTIIVSMMQQGGSRTSRTVFPCNECFRDHWMELQEHLLPEDLFFRMKEVSCAVCGHKFQGEKTVMGAWYCSIGCREKSR